MIRVKHAPSAAAIGESAYTIGRGEKRRWATDIALKQQALGLQAASIGAQASARAGQLALQKERQDFAKEQWREEPARQLERGLQQQKLLQGKVAYEYTESQKRRRAQVIEGLNWLQQRDDWTPEQKEDAANQLWGIYHKIIPGPVDVGPAPDEIWESGLATDKTTGVQRWQKANGDWESVGMSEEHYLKAVIDAAKVFTTQDLRSTIKDKSGKDIENKDFGKESVDWEKAYAFVDDARARFAQVSGFAARAEDQKARQQQKLKRAADDVQQKEQEEMQAQIEALPEMFENISKGQPKIGRKRKGPPSLFADDVYGEEAYNKMRIEAVERGEQKGIPPDVVLAEFDEWWDEQYDKYRGERFQKFGNRMEFKGAEPESQEEFIRTIQGMDDKKEAKAYYDKWASKWQ